MHAIMRKCLNNFRKTLKMFRRDGHSSKAAAEVDTEHAVVAHPDSWADLTAGWNQNGIVPHDIAEVRRRIDADRANPDAMK